MYVAVRKVKAKASEVVLLQVVIPKVADKEVSLGEGMV